VEEEKKEPTRTIQIEVYEDGKLNFSWSSKDPMSVSDIIGILYVGLQQLSK